MRFDIPEIDSTFHLIARERLNNLTKPLLSLGRLEEFAERYVAIKGERFPDIRKKAVFVFAGDHGVTEEGVSAYPKEVTYQMVFNFLRGGAAINVLSRFARCDCMVVDIGVDYEFGEEEGLIRKKVIRGTKNFTKGPAMERAQAEKSIEVGRELAHEYAEKGYDIFCAGEMGIGNTTSASAIAACLLKRPVRDVVGRGTGIDDETLERKIEVIERALKVNQCDSEDPIDVLAKIGGAEIGGMAGLILGAAEKRIPTILDGLISVSAGLIAFKIEPKVRDFLFAGHRSKEKGQWHMLEEMGLSPILDLDMRLGEGTGAVLALLMIEAGIRIYREMATFDEAEVSKKRK